MKESQKSAVIFINSMMILFYVSLFAMMLSFWLTIANQKVHILFYISVIIYFVTIFTSLLVEKLDENPFKSNITYKARWIKKNK